MRRRVLIVDDDAAILQVARVALEVVAGWHVTTTDSGLDGLVRARQTRPDVIFMDLVMPGAHGAHVVECLQDDAATRSIPVILFTAQVQAVRQQKFDALGLAGIIVKPFDPMTLHLQAAKILGWQE